MKDWRDPNMTVSVSLRNPNRTEEWDSNRFHETMVRRFYIINVDPVYRQLAPHWSEDPTYNLRRSRPSPGSSNRRDRRR